MEFLFYLKVVYDLCSVLMGLLLVSLFRVFLVCFFLKLVEIKLVIKRYKINVFD